MPPQSPKNNSAEDLKHEEAKRNNIPTAAYQSVMAAAEKNSVQGLQSLLVYVG